MLFRLRGAVAKEMSIGVGDGDARNIAHDTTNMLVESVHAAQRKRTHVVEDAGYPPGAVGRVSDRRCNDQRVRACRLDGMHQEVVGLAEIIHDLVEQRALWRAGEGAE